MGGGKEGKTSRLQQLLVLLEGGSSQDIRKAAAKQIVQITQQHPQQIPSVARKVHACLYHKQWDSRVAAGEAFGLLAEAFPHHTAAELHQASSSTPGPPSQADAPPNSALQSFNIKTLLEKGTALLASGGQEFDLSQEPGLTAKQRLEKQKALLKKRLGLDVMPEGLMDTDELVNDDDLDVEPSAGGAGAHLGRAASSSHIPAPAKQAASELLAGLEGLSARERNRLKRKAKALSRADSMRSQDGGASRQASLLAPAPSLAAGQGSKLGPGGDRASAEQQAAAGASDEEIWMDVCAGEWPFQWAADQMLVDVLDPCWEVRHGAAMGLRELLKSHAGSAGVVAPVADEVSGWMMAGGAGKRRLHPVTPEASHAAVAANQGWLCECVLLLLCVLALDHFADYGSDQVTAPVRETAAQALALALAPLSHATIMHVVTLLEQLQRQSEWAVRYGGYLGIKYVVAARIELAHTLLPRQLPFLTDGLKDSDDDVCAACAAALVPVSDALEALGPQVTQHITQLLWDRLDVLDSLSPASASCLQLLAHLYSSPTSCGAAQELGQLIPRLWPYLGHTLTSVRLSTAQCLDRLLTVSAAQGQVAWLGQCLSMLLQLVFQRILVEGDVRLQAAWLKVWQAALTASSGSMLTACMQSPPPCDQQSGVAANGAAADPSAHMLYCLFKLAATPTGQPLPSHLLAHTSPDSTASGSQANNSGSGAAKRARVRDPGAAGGSREASLAPRDQSSAAQLLSSFTVGCHGDGSAVRMRFMSAQALSALLGSLSQQGASQLALSALHICLQDASATMRQLASLALWHWMGSADPAAPDRTAPCTDPTLHQVLQVQLANPSPHHPLAPASSEPYTEARAYLAQLQREVLALVTACMAAGWLLHTPGNMPIEQLSTEHVAAMLTQVPAAPPESQVCAARDRVASLNTSLETFEQYLVLSTLFSFAAASIRSGQLPGKLNMLLQPLMAALRKEPEPQLQDMCAQALAELLLVCASRVPSPNDKLVRNLCSMCCADAAEVPSAEEASARDSADAVGDVKVHAQAAGKLGTPEAPGAEAGAVAAAAVVAAMSSAAAAASSTAEAQAARIARLGAEAALVAVCRVFQAGLWTQLPSLWQVISAPLEASDSLASDPAAPAAALQSLINALQILRVVGPKVSPALVPSLQAPLHHAVTCTGSTNSGLRLAAGRCAAALAGAWMDLLMPQLLRSLVPRLGHLTPTIRLGAVEVVVQLVADLGAGLAPWVVLLVVPLLRCMSDAHEAVRSHASSCFGALVALLPLAQGLPPPPGLDDAQLETASKDSQFLLQLLDNKRAADFQLPVTPSVQLRPYQQEGINWLAFLRRFGLHGVLADDMGLGKTLQASCILAAALVEAQQQQDEQAAAGAGSQAAPVLPAACLVVCPSTLVQHWCHEVGRFMDTAVLRAVAYCGNPSERTQLQKRLNRQWSGQVSGSPAPNLVVISYEHLKSDLDWITSRAWLYCVLDEGHVIKSHKSKIAQACRAVAASHRLILSGTPIQNSVIELWSLFEFLMPGFLGSEKDFNARYGKALKAAKYSKQGSQEAEAGLLAVDSLHKQVMPFVLRRTKAQVLQDLPPKIVQDIYCDLSPLQAALYEDFRGSQASGEAASALKAAAESSEGGGGGGSGHVFTALQYMRRLCSHPALVLDLAVPQHEKALKQVVPDVDVRSAAAVQGVLSNISHAPKLVALRDLLSQCGLIAGEAGEEASELEEETVRGGAGHRLLVFAQMKGMLDLVERDVLQPLGVTFLRIDGSVDPSSRFGIVQRFNADPTIDVLLLTTSVGGQGLNLTSADTVVFLEHDWNPMKDLQAMDRAHRLGQTRTVNVYRLLMRNTLEEQVMGLQKFKLDVANAVVNQENMSLTDMDTGRLLQLFGTADAGAGGAGQAAGEGKAKSGLQAMLAQLGDLWDEEDYSAQFNMQSFMQKLGKGGAGGSG